MCDDENFGTFFSRVLTRDYPQYEELLRLEPGKAKYDWLIEEYFELQRTHSGETAQSGTSGNTLTNKKGIGITVHTSGDDTDAHTGTVGNEGQNSSSSSGSNDTSTEYQGETTTSGNNSGSSDDNTDSSHIAVNKQNPMSNSYSATAGEIPALSWGTMSAQEQTKDHTKTSSSTSGSSSSTESFKNRKDVTSGSNSGSTNGTTSDTTNYNDTMTHSHDVTVRTEYDEDKADTTETSGSSSTSGSDKYTDRELHTGRHGNVSDIIKAASEYIKGSSSWEWLRKRLEVCFLGVYDI